MKPKPASILLAVCAVLLGALLLPLQAAHGAPPALHLMQLHHTVWTPRDGMPSDPTALAQTRDGFLWIGANDGLVRFDGIRFERFDPGPDVFPDHDVYALHAGRDGSLWVGWRLGGITRIQDGRITNVAAEDGIPDGSIWAFAEDRQGRLWAAGLAGLARFDGGRWQRIGPESGFHARKASALFVDRDGTVAVFSERGLYLMAPGADRFAAPLPGPDVRQPPQRAPDGTLYFMQDKGIRAIGSLATYARRDRPFLVDFGADGSGSMLAGADGTLWFDTSSALVRQPDPASAAAGGRELAPRAQQMRLENGLSGRTVRALLEDSEHNVWVITTGGLDRFRRASAAPVLADGGDLHGADVLAGPDGAVDLFGDLPGTAWLRVTPDGAQRLVSRVPGRFALRARDGSLWRGVGAHLEHAVPGAPARRIALPADLPRSAMAHAMAEDGDGAMWVAVIHGGMLRFQDGQWRRDERLPGAGKDTALSLAGDARGRLWLGYGKNRVAVRDADGVRVFGEADGLQLGRVTMLSEIGGTMWAVGPSGVAFLHGGRFVPLRLESGLLRNVASLAQAPDGAVWLNTNAGLVSIDDAEVRAALAAPAHAVRVRRYGEHDGVSGSLGALDQQSIDVASDGVVWFATGAGVFRLDPRHLVRHVRAPQVSVLRAHAGTAMDAPRSVTLAPGQRDVSFDYAAPSLALAERIRFRYRLHGYDNGWQDAGARHQAFYTGLAPGRYRFEVAATNPDGAWNGRPAAVDVTVAPQFHQTLAFKLLAAGLALGVLYCLHRLRLVFVERRLRTLLHAQQTERERIARELHDTLLQGVQALVLRFHMLAARLPAGDPLQREMEKALDSADGVLQDSRDRVQGLRADAPPDGGIVAALRREAGSLARERAIALRFALEGETRTLAPACEAQCYWIALEAMTNALRHADAGAVDVTLAWRNDAFAITVRDDGRGMPRQVADHGRSGHFGLQGMRERAADIGATLAIDAEQGTVVTLRVPAKYAYA